MIFDIAIIGGGVAGCAVAYHARKHGMSAIIIEAGSGIASCASGNLVGLVKPVLDISNSPFFQFHKSAFQYFLDIWPNLGLQPLFQGIVQLPLNETERLRDQRRAAAPYLPRGWAEWQSATQISQRLGMKCLADGIWLPQALAIDPHAYCAALAGDTPVMTNTRVTDWQRFNDAWQLSLNEQKVQARTIIICAGVEVLGLPALEHLPIRPKRGQLTYLPAEHAPALKHPVTFGHYLAPAVNGQMVLGATYTPCSWNADLTLSDAEHQQNLAAYKELQKVLPELAPAVLPPPLRGRVDFLNAATPNLESLGRGDRQNSKNTPQQYSLGSSALHQENTTSPSRRRSETKAGTARGETEPVLQGRAAIRATTPQHLPLYGHWAEHDPDQQGIYYLTGLGSRGLMTAPNTASLLINNILNKL